MHISLKSKLHQDAQRGLYLESAMHIWALSYGLWHVCIFYEAALNHSDKQRYLFNIMPGFHPSIYPFASIFFAAANATARTETKLSLWQPPSSSSWSADAFACSLYHPPPPSLDPNPCSSSNLSLKTSFLPIFFPPHICTSITWPGESCGLRSGCCLGEEKRSVCQSPFLRGQRSAPPSFDLPLTSGTAWMLLKNMSVVPLQLVNLYNECFTTASFAEQKCEIWITVQLPDLILSNICTNRLVCFNKNSLCPPLLIMRPVNNELMWLSVRNKKAKKMSPIIDILVKERNKIWGKSGAVYGLVQTLTIITNILLWLVLF